jgi:hypothetical protein
VGSRTARRARTRSTAPISQTTRQRCASEQEQALEIPIDDAGARAYNARNPEATRKTAARNELLVERITEVRVLDPYFYL